MKIPSYTVGSVFSRIETILREKLKIEARLGDDLFEFAAFTDDETFSRVVGVCRFHPEWVVGDDVNYHEASYVVFYISRYAPALRELVRKSDRLWDAVVEVLRLVDSGVPYGEAVKRANMDKDLVEFVRRYGPIPLYEDGVRTAVLLLPSPAELKNHGVDAYTAAERVVSFVLKNAELEVDQVKLPSGHVYRPTSPFEFYTRLLQASNLTARDNVFRVLRSMLFESISQMMKCEQNECYDTASSVCTNLGTRCDLKSAVRVKPELTDRNELKVGVWVGEDYAQLYGSVVTKGAVPRGVLVDAVKDLVSKMISYASTIQAWMSSVGATQSSNEIEAGKNLRIRLEFENTQVERDTIVFSLPKKAVVRFTVITKYVPDALLKEALSGLGVNVETRRERLGARVLTYVTGSIEVPIEDVASALDKVLEVRDAVARARKRYREHVERSRPFRTVEDAVAAYLSMVSSPLPTITENSGPPVEPGTVLTSLQRLIMLSGKHTAVLMRDMYKNYWANALIASPQAVVAALIRDGVLSVSDHHVYIRGKDVEELLSRYTDNPSEVEVRIRDFVLADVLIYAAEKKDYEVLSKLAPYVTADRLRAVLEYITPLLAIRMLDAGVGDQESRNLLARKVLEEGTPRQKTYVVYKYLRDVLKGVPNISLTKVDGEYVLDIGAFYVQIDSLNKDSVTVIAYRKDTKIGFRFSGSTFKEALRNAALNYDRYLEKLKVKKSDVLAVLEAPKTEPDEEKVSA